MWQDGAFAIAVALVLAVAFSVCKLADSRRPALALALVLADSRRPALALALVLASGISVCNLDDARRPALALAIAHFCSLRVHQATRRCVHCTCEENSASVSMIANTATKYATSQNSLSCKL